MTPSRQSRQRASMWNATSNRTSNALMPNRVLYQGLVTSRWDRCSWTAQSLYVRLLLVVCDYGRYEADPAVITAHAFPTRPHFRPSSVRKLLAELEKNGLIELYQHADKTYLQILRLEKLAACTQIEVSRSKSKQS